MLGDAGVGLQGRVGGGAVEVGGEEVVSGGRGDGGCGVDCCGRVGVWAVGRHVDRLVELVLKGECKCECKDRVDPEVRKMRKYNWSVREILAEPG